MNRADLERLSADLQRNPLLLEELKGQATDSEGLVRWARGRGYEVTAEELRALLDSDRELSDDELEEAAGGDWGGG